MNFIKTFRHIADQLTKSRCFQYAQQPVPRLTSFVLSALFFAVEFVLEDSPTIAFIAAGSSLIGGQGMAMAFSRLEDFLEREGAITFDTNSLFMNRKMLSLKAVVLGSVLGITAMQVTKETLDSLLSRGALSLSHEKILNDRPDIYMYKKLSTPKY